jgi:hypothetical protein
MPSTSTITNMAAPQMPPKRHEPIALLSTRNLNPADHAADKTAIEMVLVHNIFIRALNSMYYHAAYVTSTKDVRDFLRFCSIFVSGTHLHHDAEEQVLFPYWAEVTGSPDLMKANTEEHAAFHTGLDALGEYVTATTPEAYRAEQLVALLDELAPPLVAHLTHEIDTMLLMRAYDSAQVEEGTRRAGEHSVSHATKDEQLPFIFGCNDVTFEGGKHKSFPPIPYVVNLLTAWWFSRKYSGAWRFLPSDLYGRPKKPVFGPDAE